MNKITRTLGNVTLSLSSLGRNGEGRTVYNYKIEGEGLKYSSRDLKSGCQGGNLKEGMESLLSFLGAAGESFSYSERMGHDGMDGENSDMFPREITEWAANNSDELAMLGLELEESK